MRPMRYVCLLASMLYAQEPAAWHDPSPHRVQFVTVAEGVRLEVLDWGGSGRPVVLLAGYLTGHAYDDFAPKLTDIAHVYGITRRGLGASSKPSSGYTARESAEDVVRVLDALKLEKPVLAGHSFGGQDLSVLGATHPDRMAGLVYLDSAEDISLSRLRTASDRWTGNLPERLRNPRPDMRSFEAYREWQRKTYGLAFPEAELRQSYASNPDGTLGRYLVSKEVRDALFAGLEAPDYARIRVPVLAFFGLPMALEDQLKRYQPQDVEQAAAMGLKYGVDLAWVARNSDALKRGVPGARIVELVGANTYIFLSNEAEVLREMRAFVTGLD